MKEVSESSSEQRESPKTLSTRVMSGFPLSVGTGLAMETLFTPVQEVYDDQREVPEPVDPTKYEELWVNLSTLYRNMVGSMEHKSFMQSDITEIVSYLQQEIEVIQGLCHNEGKGLIRPVFYDCDYLRLTTLTHRSIAFRKPTTAMQVEYAEKEKKVMKQLLQDNPDCLKFRDTLQVKTKTKSLMLTHIPFDLVSRKYFRELELLESNTGAVKPHWKWNTKYYRPVSMDLTHLPFTRKLLLIFGDRVQIRPYDMRLRQLILETSRKRAWTPMTTNDKVLFDLNMDIKEPMVLEFLAKL